MMEGEQTSLREHTRDAFKNETKHRKYRTRTRATPPPPGSRAFDEPHENRTRKKCEGKGGGIGEVS